MLETIFLCTAEHDGWVGGGKDGWVDGGMEGWVDGWMPPQKRIYLAMTPIFPAQSRKGISNKALKPQTVP